jgi:hypothetical protein
VDAGPFKPLALVEAMSIRAMFTRVEVKLTDVVGTPELSKPPEKGGSVPTRTSLRKGDQIIDVQVAPPREAFAQTETGYGYRVAILAQRRKLVAGELL